MSQKQQAPSECYISPPLPLPPLPQPGPMTELDQTVTNTKYETKATAPLECYISYPPSPPPPPLQMGHQARQTGKEREKKSMRQGNNSKRKSYQYSPSSYTTHTHTHINTSGSMGCPIELVPLSQERSEEGGGCGLSQ